MASHHPSQLLGGRRFHNLYCELMSVRTEAGATNFLTYALLSASHPNVEIVGPTWTLYRPEPRRDSLNCHIHSCPSSRLPSLASPAKRSHRGWQREPCARPHPSYSHNKHEPTPPRKSPNMPTPQTNPPPKPSPNPSHLLMKQKTLSQDPSV